jgi:tripartite-type tricarboxylate transporter receptor subunit TctC
MKKRLNITVEEQLLEKIKKYAEEHETSVSSLVEEHFELLTKPKSKIPGGMSLVEYMQSLPKSKVNFPDDFNWKEEIYKERAKKYGLENLF